MRALNPTLTGIALAAALCSLACEPPRPTGEARGPALYETCVQCHGEKGEGNVNALAPALAGLPQWYLERQLNNYQNGLRGKHFDDLEGLRMRPMSMAMEEEGDIKLVAAHIATFPAVEPVALVEGGKAKKGKTAYGTCSACHGAKGEGNVALNAPPLNAQHDWYLVRSLQKFKEKVRAYDSKDTYGMQMQPMAMPLDDQAMKDVVAYIQTL